MYDSGWLLFVGTILFFVWAIYTLQEGLWPNRYYQNSMQYIVLVVKDLEDTIEKVMWEVLDLQRQLAYDTHLVVVDINSQDATLEIIKRMNYSSNFFSISSIKSSAELRDLLKEFKKENKCLVIDYRRS